MLKQHHSEPAALIIIIKRMNSYSYVVGQCNNKKQNK